MSNGTIGWRELMSPDPEKSQRFYGELFGWSIKTVPFGPDTYRLINAGEKQIAGIMNFKKPGIPPHWVSYVTVSDVDAAANAAKANGGSIANAPMDIPDVGRFAVLLDPFGAVSVAFKTAHPERDGAPPTRPGTSEFCWETLTTSDAAKAIAFYSKVYPWTSKKGGPGDSTDLFYAGDRMIADIQKTPPGAPPSWLTYVVVGKLAEARERAKKLGGKILMDEIEVPGMGAFAVAQDDLGAVIGLFESRG
jgi:predicted enzyme related to lactoylglutathione lyase